MAWLNELMLWLGKWVPRPVLITAGSVGVLFGRAGKVDTLQPGFYVYWPIIQSLTLVSTRRRTSEIAGQLLGRECIALVVSYSITDPETMLLAFNDVFSLLDDRAQVYLGRHYVTDIASAALAERIHGSMVEEFETCGVTVHSISVISRGRVLPLKNINDWAQHAAAVLE